MQFGFWFHSDFDCLTDLLEWLPPLVPPGKPISPESQIADSANAVESSRVSSERACSSSGHPSDNVSSTSRLSPNVRQATSTESLNQNGVSEAPCGIIVRNLPLRSSGRTRFTDCVLHLCILYKRFDLFEIFILAKNYRLLLEIENQSTYSHFSPHRLQPKRRSFPRI